MGGSPEPIRAERGCCSAIYFGIETRRLQSVRYVKLSYTDRDFSTDLDGCLALPENSCHPFCRGVQVDTIQSCGLLGLTDGLVI